MYLKMALMLIFIATSTAQTDTASDFKIKDVTLEYVIECRKNGMYLDAPSSQAYEVCVNRHCISEELPPIRKLIKLPPEELILEYEATLKLRYDGNYQTIIKTCPAQQFCSAIECTICLTNILNPECWPIHAVVALGAILYVIVALCYTICYVPVTVGRPIRLIFEGVCGLFYLTMYIIAKGFCGIFRLFRTSRRKRSKIMEALAIMGLLHCTLSCQTVNILSHHMQSCTTSSNRTICSIETISVLKINPFKKNACFRLKRNETIVMEVRLQWEHLRMLCEKVTVTYTRDVKLQVIDSKRCAHMGSCSGNKCSDVNSTSLLPELELGNGYPGITGCLESCGGPGCDCFYWNSGCLFYRIYAVPNNNQTYEIFTCAAWKEVVKLRMQIKRVGTRSLDMYVLALQPNVPVEIGTTTLTLSVLAPPPLPEMDTYFITTGGATALLSKETRPTLQCQSPEKAEKLQCAMENKCSCTAAESQVRCRCEDYDIEKKFKDIVNILPVTRPYLRFKKHPKHAVLAEVDQGVSTELILNVKEAVDEAVIDVSDDTCLIANTHILGCYNCNRGAVAEINCKSTKANTTAEINCSEESFTVPCSASGTISKLYFMLTEAQVRMNCTVKCGNTPTYFEITGILKYIHRIHNGVNNAFRHYHNSTSEFRWPDFRHIAAMYLQWYKTVVATVLVIVGILALTYLYFMSACRAILHTCMKLTLKVPSAIVKIAFRLFCCLAQRFAHVKITKIHSKNNEKSL
uniref:Phlebovirus_G2 domain-containing protein n=1 Tax=Haemonchus contortus TaxID=6289 RepID=A0A7I4YVW9_HAECO